MIPNNPREKDENIKSNPFTKIAVIKQERTVLTRERIDHLKNNCLEKTYSCVGLESDWKRNWN